MILAQKMFKKASFLLHLAFASNHVFFQTRRGKRDANHIHTLWIDLLQIIGTALQRINQAFNALIASVCKFTALPKKRSNRIHIDLHRKDYLALDDREQKTKFRSIQSLPTGCILGIALIDSARWMTLNDLHNPWVCIFCK